MKRHSIMAAMAAVTALAFAHAPARAQEPAPAQPQQPRVTKPARPSFADAMKRNLQRVGAAVDESRSNADMVVSNYPDPKGGKITVVIVNDRRKNLTGFYIYNFGSLKNVSNREEVYKYLLSTNDAITIGSFFVDGEEDIGYKYLISSAQALNSAAFDLTYLTMATVARERRAEIRQMLGGPAGKDEKPEEVKKAAEEKPPR